MTIKKSTNLNISTAFKELEEIAQNFEKDQIDLEKSIPQFKRAAVLSKFLKKRLSELENKIQEISLDFEEIKD